MSDLQYFHARTTQDDPWFVSKYLPKDIYLPKEYSYVGTKLESETSLQKMTAEEARKKGLQVDDYIDDDTVINVEVTEEVEKKFFWSEIRLHLRGTKVETESGEILIYPKRTTRLQKIREELAVAIENPLTFVGYPKFVEHVLKKIDYYKVNVLKNMQLDPCLLVLLGMQEADGDHYEHGVHTREVYLIQKYAPPFMHLIDIDGRHIHLTLESGILEQGRVRKLILFLPNNVELVDETYGQVIV